MKLFVAIACLALASCGTASTNETSHRAQVTTSTDAVAAKAVRDTEAAEAEAMHATDAQLGAGADRSAGAAKTTDRVSNTTKVEVY